MGGPKGRRRAPRTAGRSEAEDRKRRADLQRSGREERRPGGAGKSGPRDGFAGCAVVPGLRPRSRRWVRAASEDLDEIGRASCRERVCQFVYNSVVAVSLKKKNKI